MNVVHAIAVNYMVSAIRWVHVFVGALEEFANALEGFVMPFCLANDFFVSNLLESQRKKINKDLYFFSNES